MSMSAGSAHHDMDPEIIEQAADWLILLQSGTMSAEKQRALMHWQHQTPQHAATWERAQAMLDTFACVPAPIAKITLGQVEKTARRRNLKLLGMLFVAVPAGWMVARQDGWQNWAADYQTATGERKTIHLADGTMLVLNTSSAVDVVLTETERRITLLSGEILITTGKDPSPAYRPFIVTTAQGQMRALGTKFAVRSMDKEALTRLDVFEGAVEVQTRNAPEKRIVQSGQQQVFSGSEMQDLQVANISNMLWEQGMLLAKEMPLGELLHELGRYRKGILRCDPEVADLPISGAFSLSDTDESLRLLMATFPIRIRRMTSYWVTVSPV
jgi:transmembrane sensor